jgi:hypothetical protein
MKERTLYSIEEARQMLGGISRNGIYQMLQTGRLSSVVLGYRRFISAEAIAQLIAASTTQVSPSVRATRNRKGVQEPLPFCLTSTANSRRRVRHN